MQLKSFLQDDDAVSPVIGVILMVAITVILAAVIASFVLGLGNQASNTNPQASFGFSYEETETDKGALKISHNSGDAIKPTELYIRGSGFLSSAPADWSTFSHKISPGSLPTNWPKSYATGADSQVVSGNFVHVAVSSDFEVDVVYESTDGSSSTTLGSKKGPDA